MHLEVAGDVVTAIDDLDRGALERDEWELFGVEEIGGAEVVIPLFVVRVDAVGLQVEDEGVVGWIGVEAEGAGDVVESAEGPADAGVGDLEIDGDVAGIDVEFVGPRPRGLRRLRENRDWWNPNSGLRH